MPLKDPEARRAYNAARYAAKRDQLIAWQKDYYVRNRPTLLEKQKARHDPDSKAAYDKERYAATQEQQRERKRIYAKENGHKITALLIRRKTRRQMATPPWADLEAMKAIYQKAQRLRSEGHNVEVDHIIPLLGKLVCGLHVESNLRIVPAPLNRSKGNRFG